MTSWGTGSQSAPGHKHGLGARGQYPPRRHCFSIGVGLAETSNRKSASNDCGRCLGPTRQSREGEPEGHWLQIVTIQRNRRQQPRPRQSRDPPRNADATLQPSQVWLFAGIANCHPLSGGRCGRHVNTAEPSSSTLARCTSLTQATSERTGCLLRSRLSGEGQDSWVKPTLERRRRYRGGGKWSRPRRSGVGGQKPAAARAGNHRSVLRIRLTKGTPKIASPIAHLAG